MVQVKINPCLFLLTGSVVWILAFTQCKSGIKNDVTPIDLQIENSFLRLIGQPLAVLQHRMDSVLNGDKRLTEIVSEYILQRSDSLDEHTRFLKYFSDSSRTRLRDSCDRIFESIDWKKELGLPLARYHQAFPDRDVPVIHLLITDFNYGLFVFQDDQGRDAIGIGEEMFTGNVQLYDQLALNNPNFSSYLNRTFNTAHLPSKVIQALLSDLLPAPSSNRLLDHIIYEGKKLYITKQLIPGLNDTILHEYTPAQWAWVTSNEWDIWRFLLTDKLLYQSKGKDVVNLVQPAPHSQGMPPEAPGRAVNYIGMKIVEALARKEKLNLQQIAAMENGEEILQKSRYKPR